MNFFEVTAKCGHVGRNYYYKGVFYVQAENGKLAAKDVRTKPRVKHDRKDAILSVVKVDYETFKLGEVRYRSNPYFYCHNKQEQIGFLPEIDEKIYYETDDGKHKEHNNSDRRAKIKAIQQFYRKMDKYGIIYKGV